MKDFFEYDPILNGSKGLLFIGEKLLLYRRDSKPTLYPLYLDLPGGGKEDGETPFDTFQREVKEEFGLTIQQSDITYVRRYLSVIAEGEHAYFPVAKLPAEAQESIHFGDEGLEYLLISVEEFLSAPDVWPGLQAKTIDYLNSQSDKKTKIVRPWIIVVAAILLAPVVLVGVYFGWAELNYLQLKREIDRVASQSDIQSLTVKCSLEMSFFPECDATYPRMTYNEQVSMLSEAGYDIWEPISGSDPDSVDATSPSGNIIAGANYDESNETMITYRFK